MAAFLQNSWLALLLTVVIAYLLGSINSAIIVTRIFSKDDIRDHGSGNAGATNVLRSQGKLPAVLTTIGDLLKSLIAVLVGGWLMTHLNLAPDAALSGSWAADKELVGLASNIGKNIEINLFKPLDGKKQYRGILNSFDKEIITIIIEDLQKKVERKKIAQIKTIYEW